MRLNVQYFTHVLKQEQTPEPKTVSRISGNLIEQIDHLSKVASQFKIFAQMEAPATEPLDLISFLEEFILPFKTRKDYQFNFVRTIDKDIRPTINIDSEHLQQILLNLISNAENAIDESRQGIITIDLKKKYDKVVIEVRDNGSGIDSAIQKNLFDPKFSTNSSRTGLGLPICQRIIDFYGGKLSFTTGDGVGTSFYIDFSSI